MEGKKKASVLIIFLILQLTIASWLFFVFYFSSIPFYQSFPQSSHRSAPSYSSPLSCTELVATGNATFPPNKTYIGGTSDDPWNTRTVILVREPSNGYKFIGTKLIASSPVDWSNMVTRGLNEKGFAYTWQYCATTEEPPPEGMNYSEFGNLFLKSCTTVEEGIEFIRSITPSNLHGNFYLADAKGEVAIVEVSYKQINVAFRTTDGAMGWANTYFSRKMDRLNPAKAKALPSNLVRAERITELIKRYSGRINMSTLHQIFSDHQGRNEIGYSICQHDVPAGKISKSGTVSSELIQPKQLTFWYCYGWPCGESPEDPAHQLYQNGSWGFYLPFYLPELEEGNYTILSGELTPLAIEYLKANSEKLSSICEKAGIEFNELMKEIDGLIERSEHYPQPISFYQRLSPNS
jgi:hypothetical protein